MSTPKLLSTSISAGSSAKNVAFSMVWMQATLSVFERGANVCRAAYVDHAVVVEHCLAAHMRHDLRLEARGVGGGNLIGDKRGEALCPRRVADLCERDGAGVALDEVEILRMRFVAGEITVGAGGKAQVEIERGPADSVGGVAV